MNGRNALAKDSYVSVHLALALGGNQIVVRAVDAAGNQSVQTVTVTRQNPPDTTAPVIAIITPANNTVTPDAAVTVTGTADDLGSNASGINRVVVNGQPAAYNPATKAWTILNVQLSEGSNTIRAVAFDNAASTPNQAATAIVVTRRTPDTAAPTLQIESPANNSETYDSSITINGTAVDEGTNASGINRVEVNGQPAFYDQSTHRWTATNVALTTGENTFTVAAFDNAAPIANQAQAQVQVVRREIPPPTIAITNPTDNSTTTEASVAVIGAAQAFGPDSNRIVSVSVNGNAATYDATNKTWTLAALPLELGANTIIVKAVDAAGKEATARVTVTRSQTNRAPIVNAGADQTILLPQTVTLSGTVTDDGRPAGGSLKVEWSKVSGPGDVTFTNQNAVDSGASFSIGGIYVLRLTANDGAATGSDDLVVTVNPFVPACPSDDFADDFNDNKLDANKWIVSDAASPTTIAEQNAGLEVVLTPNTFGYNSVSSRAAFDFNGRSFQAEVPQVSSQGGYTETFISLRADDNNYYLIDAGAGSFIFDAVTNGARDRSGDSFSPDIKFWRIRHKIETNSIFFETSSNGAEWTIQKTVAATFSLNAVRFAVGAGAFGTGNSAPGKAIFENVRLTPSFPNCGLIIQLINPVDNTSFAASSNIPVAATVSDRDGHVQKIEFFSDGIEIGEDSTDPYNIEWRNVAPGTYRLRAKATNDQGFEAFSPVVTVTAAPVASTQNQPPLVDAGPDQAIKASANLSLIGIVSDDNLPTGNAVTTLWSKVSGPGEVSFANPKSAETIARFGLAGYYTLRLTASDGEATAHDDVLIKVGSESARIPGGIFITGHDSDDHALYEWGDHGAKNIIRRAVEYVTYNHLDPKILLVTDLRNPGGDQADSRLGLEVTGYKKFDVADYGSGAPETLNLKTVNFADYDVIIVASDYGGWLRQDELDVLNSRRQQLIDYVNNGGGIVAFSESGARAVPPGEYSGTLHHRFAFIPFAVSPAKFNQGESDIRTTAFGRLIGLADEDVNHHVSHNIFLTTGGMKIVDKDGINQIVSLAVRGKYITGEGIGNDQPLVEVRATLGLQIKQRRTQRQFLIKSAFMCCV